MNIERIRELLAQVPSPPGEGIPDGVATGEIEEFERRTGLVAPDPLREWLQLTNGPCVGPGGYFGIHPKRLELDIEHILDIYPEFLAKKWIPVAGDGCGNYYVVPTHQEYGQGFPVLFIEAVVDYLSPAYIAASDLAHFLPWILEKELCEIGEHGWPFDEQFVTNNDPQILSFHDVPLPWNA
jgi:hypothetical protein